MANKKSKPPKNLSITRSGDTYICHWACGDKNYNDGQKFKYAIIDQHGYTKPVKIGKNTWERNITVSSSINFSGIRFAVCGNRDKTKNDKYTMSAWSEGALDIELPRLPSITPSVATDEYFKTTFSWNIVANDSDPYIFTTYKWESIVVKTTTLHGPSMASIFNEAANPANQARYDYRTGSGNAASGSAVINEQLAGSFNLANGESWTRWFRMTTGGPRGWNSDWSYSYHTYAMPSQITDVKAELIKQSSDSGYTCGISWRSAYSDAHPTGKVKVNYAIETPVTSYRDVNSYVKTLDDEIVSGKNYYIKNQNGSYELVTNPVLADIGTYYEVDHTSRIITVEPPSSLSWTSMGINDNHSSQSAAITINEKIRDNACLFISVSSEYDVWTDSNAVFSKIIIVPLNKTSPKLGTLSMPEGLSVDATGMEFNQYEVTATNTANGVDASYLAVYYRTKSQPNLNKIVGIIGPGQDHTTVILPELDPTEARSFGVKAFLADYYPVSSGGVYTEYTVSSPIMESEEILWGREVPLPPANVTPVKIDEDTIQVTWAWTWADATGAELSWADHEDAWESTDEPQTFIVRNVHTGRWNISGLSVGRWYVRMRLLQEDGDKTTYGTYCGIKECALSESPNIPAITIPDSEKMVAPDGKFTCYWSYVTNDGTNQMNADISEVSYDSETGEISGYELLATVESAQHYTFYLGPEEGKLHWESGSTHDIAVRVTSASGERSENWSPAVQIQVAEPLIVSIDQTNLKTIIDPIEMEDPLDYIIDGEDLIAEGDPEDIAQIEEVSMDFDEYGNLLYTDDPQMVSVFEINDGNLVQINATTSSKGLYLTKLPLNVKVSGAGPNGHITAIIERFEDYDCYRPDDSEYDGFQGETIAIKESVGNGVISFTIDDIFGYLDDGGKYKLVVMIRDASGQTDTIDVLPMYVPTQDEEIQVDKKYYVKTVVDDADVYTRVINPVVADLKNYYELSSSEYFIVRWDHQAQIPSAEVEYDYDNLVAFVTPIAPNDNVLEGDVCDIYRLSADQPELVIAGASFGTMYVDPYPTLGKTFSGYRFVYKTLYGDYMTAQTADVRTMAWYNYNESEIEDDFKYFDLFAIVIDYENDQIILPYNIDISNSWSKDFTTTKYLGGSIQGDWNPSVERSTTLNTMTAVIEDAVTIQKMRALAGFSGICHVRTPDGSSFAANIDITESREERKVNMVASFSLNITRVDPEGFDGLSYEEWANIS